MRARTHFAALSVIVGICALGSQLTGQDGEGEVSQEKQAAHINVPAQPIRIESGEAESYLSVQSPAVRWHELEYHIIQFGTTKLKLDAENHLVATVKGGALTFDDVKCTIHLAVFDTNGALLGTANVNADVPRVWEGVPMLMFEEWSFDFGKCACYQDIAFIAGSVTHGKVQTPDDWQD